MSKSRIFLKKSVRCLVSRWLLAGGGLLPTANRQLPPQSCLVLSLAVIFVLFGCHRDNTLSERPPQLLSQQQMVSFLIDLHLAEAKMSYVETHRTDSTEIIFRNYEKHLTEQYGFTDSVYLRSYAYYLDHMELMNEIYDDVVDSLSVMNTQQKVSTSEHTGDKKE